MKAREFRIGNWAKSSDGGLEFRVNAADIAECLYQEGLGVGFYQPIALSGEHLLRFGAVKHEAEAKGIGIWDEFIFNGKYGTIVISDVGVGVGKYGYTAQNGVVVKLEYVHKLQNLFYVLTGEELELHEPQNQF